VLIGGLYYQDTQLLVEEVSALKTKKEGGSSVVVAYLSIGETEDYRYCWDPSWDADPPDWIAAENPDRPDSYTARYWHPDWQEIIFGSDGSEAADRPCMVERSCREQPERRRGGGGKA
jgi:cysteinyl-tRNA synthetase